MRPGVLIKSNKHYYRGAFRNAECIIQSFQRWAFWNVNTPIDRFAFAVQKREQHNDGTSSFGEKKCSTRTWQYFEISELLQVLAIELPPLLELLAF